MLRGAARKDLRSDGGSGCEDQDAASGKWTGIAGFSGPLLLAEHRDSTISGGLIRTTSFGGDSPGMGFDDVGQGQ